MIAAIAMLLAAAQSVELDVVYSKPGGEELRMDVYRPAAAVDGSMRAAVVVIHGGAWMAGKRQDMTELCKALSSAGFVAATVSYRLAPKHKWPAMLDDVQTAVRFLRVNAVRFGIDPDRLGAGGASAGGHLSLMLGFRDTRDPKPAEHPGVSSRVRAVLNIFGPVDMTSQKDFPGTLDGLFQIVIGKPREQAAAEIRDASPASFVDSGSAPVFTIHGKEDPLVPFAQATHLDAKLKAAGVSHTMELIEGMKHELPVSRKEVGDALQRAMTWLKERLAPRVGQRQAVEVFLWVRRLAAAS